MSWLKAALPLVIFIASTMSAPAHGQSLPIGSRVRVWSSVVLPAGHETTVVGARGDTILFSDAPATSQVAIPKETLSRIEVRLRRGSPGLRTVGGAALGAVGGIIAGAALGALSVKHARSTHNCPDGDCGFVYLLTLPVGALGGVIAGGVIGHHTAHFWQRVSDPQQVNVVPAIR